MLTEQQVAGRDEVAQLDSKPRWKKAAIPLLAPAAKAEDALAEIVLSGLHHLRANEACVLARAHVEGVHQMRVAVRRLRSVLALYRDMLPADQQLYLGTELKWLIGELGPARDWDVFLAETLPPVVAQFPDEPRLDELKSRVEAERDDGYVRAAAAIKSSRYTGLVMLLGAWAEGRRWNDPHSGPASEALQQPATAVATVLIHQRYRDVLTAGADFETLSPTERHTLRIQIKKLRYASEFFTALFPRRRQQPFLNILKTLQDHLGVGNDVEVARRLLLRLTKASRGKARGRLSFAAGLVVGWHGHTADNRENRLRQAWNRFIARPPYWGVPAEPPPVCAMTKPASTEAEQDIPAEAAAPARAAGPSDKNQAAPLSPISHGA